MNVHRFRPAIVTAILAGIVLAPAVHAEARYGVCRQQIVDYVQQHLGQTVTHIEVQSWSERTPPRSLLDAGSALVRVKECPGFHAFEIRGTEAICEHIPHYGTSGGSYIRYEGAWEGCAAG